jgi:hypothetical protein
MNELKIQPLGTRVVIKPLEQESKTASGLYIPETAKETHNPARLQQLETQKMSNSKLLGGFSGIQNQGYKAYLPPSISMIHH